MKYVELERHPNTHPKAEPFLHACEFMIMGRRYKELEDFLNDLAGPKHEMWRAQARFLDKENLMNPEFGSRVLEKIVIRFKQKDHALLFKLSWRLCDPDTLSPGLTGLYQQKDADYQKTRTLPIMARMKPKEKK